MSELQHLVILVNDSPRAQAVAALGARLACDHQAVSTVLYAAAPLPVTAYLTPEAASLGARLMLEAEQARRDQAAQRVAEASRATGVALAMQTCTDDPLSEVLAQARTADLLVLGQRAFDGSDGTASNFAARVLVGAGCPVLFVPQVNAERGAVGDAPRCGTRVLVAWSDSRESARALRDALPLLRRASSVELLRFSSDAALGAESLAPVAAHLRRHGVQAVCTVRTMRPDSISERMTATWTPDAPIAEALLSHAADVDADLIVMGGYGHPRAWELMLGGVTRTLLQSMTVPVLMSH